MVFYRCQHEIKFGNSRCQGEPEFDREEYGIKVGCKLTPDRCGKLIRIEEAVDLTAPWLQVKDIEEVKPKDTKSKEKGKEETKGKTKSAKKLEGEIAQKSMF
jgi:hypothetical protein